MGDISERWLDENKSVWKPTTYGAYSQIVNKYIRPALGKLDITDQNLLGIKQHYV